MTRPVRETCSHKYLHNEQDAEAECSNQNEEACQSTRPASPPLETRSLLTNNRSQISSAILSPRNNPGQSASTNPGLSSHSSRIQSNTRKVPVNRGGRRPSPIYLLEAIATRKKKTTNDPLKERGKEHSSTSMNAKIAIFELTIKSSTIVPGTVLK